MARRRKRNLESSSAMRTIIQLCDVVLLSIVMSAIYYLLLKYRPASVAAVNLSDYLIISILCYFPVSFSLPPILLGRVVRSDKIVERMVKLTFLHTLLIFAVLFVKKDATIARIFLLSNFLAFTAVICLARLLMRSMVQHYRRLGRNSQHVVIVGDTIELEELYDYLQNKEYGFNVVGVFSSGTFERLKDMKHLGGAKDVIPFLERNSYVNCVFCSMSSVAKSDVTDIYKYCENSIIRFYAVPQMLNDLRRNMTVSYMGSVMMLSSREEPLADIGNRIIKRLLDLLISSIFLLTLFPLIYAIVAIIIKHQSPGPVLFVQERNGLNGKKFKCLKFRSMHVNGDSDKVQATKNDPRKFKFGAFMRHTNIDELPQFLNVFVGDMSLVGPRPHMLYHTQEYSHLINKYMVRHWVKPGITGWAQIKGLRGETKELGQMEARVKADIWYVENWTLWLDIRILWLTLFNMVAVDDKNAY